MVKRLIEVGMHMNFRQKRHEKLVGRGAGIDISKGDCDMPPILKSDRS